jgi:phosphatidylglycerophosphate synthase
MVRSAPVVALIGQALGLGVLALTVGIGPEGWLVGLGVGLVACLALWAGLRHAGGAGLGPADWVTLTRAMLVGCVAALVAHSLRGDVPSAPVVAIAAVALVLDAVDGRVARRTHTVSRVGARFDMEVDAFLLVVLSVYVGGALGLWVLAIGALRYAFWAAGRIVPWLAGPVPPRFSAKVIAATQGIVLVVAASGLFPAPVSVTAVAVALALLVLSFGRDVVLLWRRRRASGPATPRVRVSHR